MTSPVDIARFVDAFDLDDLVARYDTDFDIPLQNRLAVGILSLAGAFDAPTDDRPVPPAVRVGAHWCGIVRADVSYDLVGGLQLIAASQPTATALHDSWSRGRERHPEAAAYALARWHDGSGKIRYRLGAFSSAHRSFETATSIARDAGLWWALPDLRSNLVRAQFEELRQAVTDDRELLARLGRLRADLDDAAADVSATAADRGIDPSPSPGALDHRTREFLRGWSSVLHNRSVALSDLGKTIEKRDRTAGRTERSSTVAELLSESLRCSVEAGAISAGLGDPYRAAQATTQQAQLAELDHDRARARELWQDIRTGRWARGRQIARQNIARLSGADGVDELRALLDEIRAQDTRAGTDIDFHRYTISALLAATGRADYDPELAAETEELGLEMARSVRRVVALPTYKRAYARQVQPVYIAAASRAVNRVDDRTGPRDRSEAYGEGLSLVEESSARELLDMISSSILPAIEPSDPLPAPLLAELAGDDPRPTRGGDRRSGLRRVSDAAQQQILDIMERRARRFENEFLRNPLDVAAHDEAISHKVMMFAANHPDTAILRYFVEEHGGRRRMSAFVIRGRSLRVWKGPELRLVGELAAELDTDTAPRPELTVRMWDLLIDEIWTQLTTGSAAPGHLVLIPAEDMFAMPLHVARPSTTEEPLGVRVPLSFSVSATAFVARGRHMLKKQAVDDTDDLAAVLVTGNGVTGREISAATWNTGNLHIAGDLPLTPTPIDILPEHHHEATWPGVARLTATTPEFFVYASHGHYAGRHSELGPYLMLRNSVVTQFDVALRLRLPRNKLTILGACLAGQGAATGGGEVAGFLRSLMAAGSGAIALPLWSVQDRHISRTAGGLLRSSRDSCRTGDGFFDAVDELHRLYRAAWDRHRDKAERLTESMPLALYL